VQFGQGAILRYSSTRTLRSQGIEDENEAAGEGEIVTTAILPYKSSRPHGTNRAFCRKLIKVF
jgi:hypothetical protein